ncbi:SusC/RagA family TonB-linked outer membrane protein [Chitinophaga pendula]|uniref:SusC/RagA family TonB-linked outer membrane protein n=1 Tax=Chitinophaga TaxID=79328 RepID=UPI000BAF9EA3|nr:MULTISPECIES: SusC/RagA family TonB-linked outer membrane protein [Chitinophaga]ASZ11738.1 SusC/RagA family TonB-linked outer membrane protein [Chitinophaga sp. MD30]UCJ05243.1 SusC/RagA family TonB-linked outer membrane protein [Chitinophaga pendula]
MNKHLLKVLLILVLMGQPLFAQNREVSGTVTEKSGGAPMPGVIVRVKGAKSGTSTNAEGKYHLQVPGQHAVLIFSFVGYTQVEHVVSGDVLDVSLVADNKQLSEIVVTAQGLKRSARELGYSVAKIDNASLTQGKVVNLATGLASKVSGLQVNLPNNGVNPEPRIVLRGNRSLTGNNQALIVVDGVPVPSAVLSNLNPNDIENVNVLKGANAANLYGSEGVNGVLMITTKKGKTGRPVVRYSNTTQFETVSMLPDMQYKFGGGSDGVHDPIENTSWGAPFDGTLKQVGPTLADGSKWMLPYVGLKDEKRKFWDRGLTVQNDVAVSAGSDNSEFYLSFQDANIKGVIPKDKNRRTGARLNASRKMGIFTAGFNAGYTVTKTNTTTANIYDNLLNIPQNVPITQLSDWRNNKWAATDGYFNGYYRNPWWLIDNQRADRMTNLFNGNLDLGLQPLSWLNFVYRVGLYNEAYTQKSFRAKVNPTTAYQRPTADNGYVKDEAYTRRRINSDILVTADHKFGDFSTKLTLGNTIRDNYDNYSSIEANGLVAPDVYNVNNRTGEATVDQYYRDTRLTALFGDLSVGFRNYLFLGVTARNEWVSILSSKNRSYFYPGASLSFVFTDAIQALQGNRTLSFGKVTLSANKTGNVNLDPYQLITPFINGTGFPFGTLPGQTLDNRFRSQELKPEFVNSVEATLQLGFFQDRLSTEISVYKTTSKGQIIPIQTSFATGYSSVLVNSGEVSIKGIEFDVKGTPVKNKNVTWTVGVNGTYLQNKVISIYGGENGTSEVPIGGYANSAYIYAVIGQQYPTLKVKAYQRDPQGRIVVDGATGYPKVANALKPVGQTNPNFMMGFNTSVKYKGFTLGIQLDYRTGNVFYNQLGRGMDFNGLGSRNAEYNREPFVIPNSVIEVSPGKFEPNTNIKTTSGGFDYWYSQYSQINENYVADATFLKLREASLTYDLPATLLRRQNIVKAASVTISGRNLLMWLPKENIWTDPEFNFTSGNAIGVVDDKIAPPTRIYGASVNITF